MERTSLGVRDLKKSFGNLHALDGVSLNVTEKKISILIGPNGSGKTTLINVISGVYKPDSGSVSFLGQDVTGLPEHKLYEMGLARTFQIPALFWKLTALENLLVADKKHPGESFLRALQLVGLRSWRDFTAPWRDNAGGLRLIHGLTALKGKARDGILLTWIFWRKELPRFLRSALMLGLRPWVVFFSPAWRDHERIAVDKALTILDMLGLSRVWDLPAYYLSGGQLKLVEIGRALMSDARLLLLDEPVSGVNPTLAHEIFSRILKLRDELGLTFFIIEHRLDIALKYVDYMFAMALGKVVASGVPDEVMNNKKVIESYLGG